MPETGTAAAAIKLLGCFELTTAGRPTRLPFQAQRMVAFVVINGVPVDRHQLADRLWPFAKPMRAQSNLRTALWRIRRDAPQVLRADRSTVGLSGDVAVDYLDLLDRVVGVDEVSIPDLLFRLRHDLLPGWDEEWLMIERERARQMRVRRLEELSRWCRAGGDIHNAICAAYGAISVEPLRESAHLALIEAHMADGNRAEAVRQLGRTTALLQTELGIEPSAMFRERVGAMNLPVLAGAPGAGFRRDDRLVATADHRFR